VKAALTVLARNGDGEEVILGVDEVLDEAFITGMANSAAAGSPDPPASLIIMSRNAASWGALMSGEWTDDA
jgi:hypothetical protein